MSKFFNFVGSLLIVGIASGAYTASTMFLMGTIILEDTFLSLQTLQLVIAGGSFGIFAGIAVGSPIALIVFSFLYLFKKVVYNNISKNCFCIVSTIFACVICFVISAAFITQGPSSPSLSPPIEGNVIVMIAIVYFAANTYFFYKLCIFFVDSIKMKFSNTG